MLFFSLGFINNHVYVPALSYDLPELRRRIEEVISSFTLNLLNELRKEFDFKLKMCLIIEDPSIEHMEEKLGYFISNSMNGLL